MSFNKTNRPSPCMRCERKGCGAYHEQCKDYIEFRDKCREDGKAEYYAKRNGRYGDYRRG